MKKKDLLPYLLFLATSLIYIHNLSSSIYGGDSGDLVAAALAKGVPHPSGYPLYTMLSITLLGLPIAATPAWKVGLISVFFSSSSVVLMYLIINKLTKSKSLGVLTSLTLASFYPFWLYAEVAEVFALHIFFILIIIYYTISFWQTKKTKYFYLTAFFSGLSLTNNQVILLFFPATALLLISADPKVLKNFKTLAKAFGLFLLGLLPYIYIPISASLQPIYNWGNAVTLSNFIKLILRKQYGWGNLGDSYSPIEALKPPFYYWRLYISPLIPILAFFGSAFLIKKRRFSLFLYLLVGFAFTGPLFFIYGHRSQLDAILRLGIIERFIAQSSLPLIILLPFGVLLIKDFVRKYVKNKVLKRALVKLTLATFFLIPLSAFIVNFGKTNLKEVWVGDDLAINILSTAPKNAILLLNTDHYIFNSLYYQIAYSEREDIKIPGAHSGFTSLIEKSSVLSSMDLESYSVDRRNLIDKNILLLGILDSLERNDIYVDVGVGLQVSENDKIIAVPWGLLNKLEYENDFNLSEEEYLKIVNQLWKGYNLKQFRENSYLISENLMLADIRGVYVLSLLRTADFMRDYYEDSEAALLFEKQAFELDPLFLIRNN